MKLKKTVLFISVNNGSDTRIRKEIKTLQKQCNLIFVGLESPDKPAINLVDGPEYVFLKGGTNQVSSYVKLFFLILKLRLRRQIYSVHVINETCLLSCFLPLLGKPIVLDIFDSLFLKRAQFLKDSIIERMVHGIPKFIIVTDENRKELIHKKQQGKTLVAPNYPFLSDFQEVLPFDNGKLNIAFVGSLQKTRGTELLKGLLSADVNKHLKIHMVGWIYDDISSEISKHEQTIYYGVKEQFEALNICGQCDYLISLYAPISQNNINASPNKIFDGILQGIPVIINKEVKVSSLVEELNVGFILEDYYDNKYLQVLNALIEQKNSFFQKEINKKDYTWESIELKLLNSHDINK